MDSQKPGKVLPISGKRRDFALRAEPIHQSEGGDDDDEPSYQDLLGLRPTPGSGQQKPLHLEQLDIDSISISPFQTRSMASDVDLEELKNSIQSRGILQPVIVRLATEASADNNVQGQASNSDMLYELVAGERRFRAAKLAGLTSIPAIIQQLDDRGSVELMIIENAQRENLNAVEEAEAYRILANRFELSHGEIATIVGKNRATVSNSIRLLQLEPEVIALLKKGELTAGHGRALLMVEGTEWQLRLARLAVKKALSVRALEGLVSRLDEAEISEEAPSEEEVRAAQSLRRTQDKIGGYLGIERVSLATDKEGRKRLTLAFDSEAAWKRFLAKIRE